MNAKNRQVIEEFRANGGVVSVRPPNGPILLLHTVGAKTGRHLVTPLIYRADGEDYVVLASMGGWKTNPAWYHNLVASSDASIEVGREQVAITAEIAEGEERDRLFALHAAEYPQFGYYQRKTSRSIPVVVLRRRAASVTT
jgi:deazaflavin-dependent oxidoreductase (nitroreductase family)